MKSLCNAVGSLLVACWTLAALPASSAVPDNRKCGLFESEKLLSQSYSFDRSEAVAGDVPVEIPATLVRGEGLTNLASATPENVAKELRQSASGGQAIMFVRRPNGITETDWNNAYAYGAAQTEMKNGERRPVAVQPIGVSFRDRDAKRALLDVTLPASRPGSWSESWTLVAVICGGADNKVLGYASAKLMLVSTGYAFWLTAVSLVGAWLLLSLATFQFYRTKLDTMWERSKPDALGGNLSNRRGKLLWLSCQSANPLFISQDSLGYGSIARFQILIFTTVVAGVLLYVFIHSGVLSDLSNTVLALLGITLIGGTLGRAASDWSDIKDENRQWLVGRGILKPQSDRPRWSDLLTNQGEIDVAKVQALLFTALIAISILSRSYTGLGAFTVPDQIMYLAAISQGAYVFGRLIPSDTRRKIDQDVNSLRKAVAEYREKPSAPDVANTYEWSKAAARMTLFQTYGDKFDEKKFEEATQAS